jgi:hypothetical protein
VTEGSRDRCVPVEQFRVKGMRLCQSERILDHATGVGDTSSDDQHARPMGRVWETGRDRADQQDGLLRLGDQFFGDRGTQEAWPAGAG